MKYLLSTIKLLTLTIFGLFQAQLFAQTEPLLKEDISQDEAGSLLWEIKGKDLSTPSYLFGTIHIISEDDFVMEEKTKNRFNAAEQIVL
ncbi:MAG: TraB/GumN family protein, partial [Bacteroidota bacterium]